MIAHSGFTRSHLPGSFSEWIKENGQKHLSDFHNPPNFPHHSAPAPAAPANGFMTKAEHLAAKGMHFGHSLGSAFSGIDVPMSVHLEHLTLTAKAERTFGYRLGFLAGFVVTALVECALKYSHLFQ